MPAAVRSRIVHPERLVDAPEVDRSVRRSETKPAMNRAGCWHLQSVELQNGGERITLLAYVPSYFLTELAEAAGAKNRIRRAS